MAVKHLIAVRHLGILVALVSPLSLEAPAIPLVSPCTAAPCAIALLFLYPESPTSPAAVSGHHALVAVHCRES